MRTMKTSQGFSLIELLVVLVILGMIAGLVVPNIVSRSEDAKARTAQTEIQRLAMAVDEFYLDAGRLPRELSELVNRPANASNWNGPYVNQSNLNDPWDNPYNYRYPGQHRTYDIFSHGADGSPGGEGAAADVNNWDN
ncbi:type II secretion system major pseudopilin GspG [Wenzhouxiangella marina]|uniref:Type II secretion system core protein G n=1 Tax=Wenzhouxiangella marina TaxID=1579979 RepID=A0A0K0XTC1_9GAMM|nr:type II secretion system major pseudopilin GspG [Wenzhouxiangella marina]AKS40866.1 general secretion pathway protein GspG [Wenzhouxiangella marina]MBB6087740.1 general secretion pathway protein G [Wenzhouxiangella marina]